ncbi:hypothetical protein [Pacificoceanicola onchidii]|uniref:hypothetical protein n=1 Tax=Pacificoceanicola onchidii TaxID=2562685 RepID=UPI0010A69AB1|nr:hypothetical protein [Pacificoceanicola onchidii]
MKRMLARLVLIGATLAASPGHALEPERREVIVTHNRVWDGDKYHENFVPSDQGEMLLLAGQDNAVSFVRTQEYYWPLSRQKYVAFERQRVEIDGVLRVTRDGALVVEVALAPFVIVYPEGAVNGNAHLVWGEAALEEFEQYRQAERDFVIAFTASQREQTRYNQALLKAGAARVAGGDIQKVEAPPPPPEPSLKLVTEPRRAYRIALQPGRYEAVVLQGGEEIPGTERTLRILADGGRNGVVAGIVPEERWTRPLPANSATDRIYTVPGTVFYATLAEASRFDEADYVALTRPQAEGVAGRDMWVKRRQVESAEMALEWTGQSAVVESTMDALKVEQTQGSEFGYVVRTASESETPDLRAFEVRVPENTEVTRATVVLTAEGAGAIRRHVVVVHPRNGVQSWGLALAPFVFGLMLIWRRRRT